jgi:hypothetical protein
VSAQDAATAAPVEQGTPPAAAAPARKSYMQELDARFKAWAEERAERIAPFLGLYLLVYVALLAFLGGLGSRPLGGIIIDFAFGLVAAVVVLVVAVPRRVAVPVQGAAK